MRVLSLKAMGLLASRETNRARPLVIPCRPRPSALPRSTSYPPALVSLHPFLLQEFVLLRDLRLKALPTKAHRGLVRRNHHPCLQWPDAIPLPFEHRQDHEILEFNRFMQLGFKGVYPLCLSSCGQQCLRRGGGLRGNQSGVVCCHKESQQGRRDPLIDELSLGSSSVN